MGAHVEPGRPKREDYQGDLRGGHDYWKALAKSWGDEMDRLRIENERLRCLLGRAYRVLGPDAHLDDTAREIKAAAFATTDEGGVA